MTRFEALVCSGKNRREWQCVDVQRRGRLLPPPPPRSPLGPPPTRFSPRLNPVDHEKTCPPLLRVFNKNRSHHSGNDCCERQAIQR